MKEFVVWGVPPNETDEVPLYTKAKTLSEAKKVAEVLTQKHGCTATRFQIIDANECPSHLWRGVVA